MITKPLPVRSTVPVFTIRSSYFPMPRSTSYSVHAGLYMANIGWSSATRLMSYFGIPCSKSPRTSNIERPMLQRSRVNTSAPPRPPYRTTPDFLTSMSNILYFTHYHLDLRQQHSRYQPRRNLSPESKHTLSGGPNSTVCGDRKLCRDRYKTSEDENDAGMAEKTEASEHN